MRQNSNFIEKISNEEKIEKNLRLIENELKNILTNNEVALLLEFEKIMFVEEEGKKKYILMLHNFWNRAVILLQHNEILKTFYVLVLFL